MYKCLRRIKLANGATHEVGENIDIPDEQLPYLLANKAIEFVVDAPQVAQAVPIAPVTPTQPEPQQTSTTDTTASTEGVSE